MDFPKLIYEDFYKFLMSLGVILFVVSLTISIFISDGLIHDFVWIFILLCVLVFIISVIIMFFAGREWYRKQQKPLNQKLQAEIKKLEAETQKLLEAPSQTSLKKQQNNTRNIVKRYENGEKVKSKFSDSPLIFYKIASVLPGTIRFDFLKDWKVWFSIENQEKNKYKAYIKIKFISEDYKEDIEEGYYGGTKPWNLNALSGVFAPGLGIPEKIKDLARDHKKIEIRIFCTINDENGNFIEKKLPVGYVYDYSNNSWYYEP